jgi:hypothetical protein
MARRRYQKGSLVPNRGIPANGLWVGRWRENVIQPDGMITRPYKWEVLGTLQDYPTRKLAQRAQDARLTTNFQMDGVGANDIGAAANLSGAQLFQTLTAL